MAQLKAPKGVMLPESMKVPANGATLARITQAKTVAEAIATVQQRLQAVTPISWDDVESGVAVSGVILMGAAQVDDRMILRGGDGNAKPHVSLRTNFGVFTPQQASAFLSGLASMSSVEDVQEAWYGFQDTHVLTASVWEKETFWETFKLPGQRYTGYLSVSGSRNVSIRLTGTLKPTKEIKARTLTLEDTAPQGTVAPAPAPSAPAPAPAPAPSAPVMKNLNGQSFTVEALKGSGWSQAQIDALPNA